MPHADTPGHFYLGGNGNSPASLKLRRRYDSYVGGSSIFIHKRMLHPGKSCSLTSILVSPSRISTRHSFTLSSIVQLHTFSSRPSHPVKMYSSAFLALFLPITTLIPFVLAQGKGPSNLLRRKPSRRNLQLHHLLPPCQRLRHGVERQHVG